MKMDKNFVIVGVLVLLIAFSIFQTVQLIGMKSNLSEIGASNVVATTSASKVTSSSDSSSSNSIPTNLQNLPGMVGGC